MLWYLPRKYRPPILFKILLGIELPVTIAILALFGIAAPDLYRTRLWKDGAQNGFNSGPEDEIYTLANYRPYTTPKPWSQLIDHYMLFHRISASPDMSDPERRTRRAWYLTKNCNVAKSRSNVGYCRQAKASFACTVLMLAIFIVHSVYAIYSCLPTVEIREKQRQRLERRKELEDLKSLKSPTYSMHTPMTPGGTGFPPMTPRTQAFNRLGGTTDLPLRNHFLPPDMPNGSHLKNFSMPSPSQSPTPPQMSGSTTNGTPPPNGNVGAEVQSQATMYFPPPPKKASK
ncbi:conserved hypothetical protein [Histoplasma capsulatum H143]|uniref:Uncharacterized protein n=1 Tax=Ajellomyces capsulatus (strain H143) TaxID=544712 RepID=C6H2P4_AJECH|nr:conserved hypothetical protein [Histoplasma capsulatum H143]